MFVSYSHRDEPLRAELEKHLALLKRQGVLDLWHDHRVAGGSEINASISEALECADVVLLLISADYVASEYCFGLEMGRAMERHRTGDCVVVPVILRPCDWKTAPFGMLKAVPLDGKPVTKWASQDEAFENIAERLRLLLKPATQTLPSLSAGVEGPLSSTLPLKPTVRSSNLSLPRMFSDRDRHDFAIASFTYLRAFFEASLEALKERNQYVETRMADLSPREFSAVIFRYGNRLGGCHIRLDSHQADSIAFNSGEVVPDGRCAEHLAVLADEQKLYLQASMNLSSGSVAKLSQQGAAEHLWSLLMGPIQRG